MPTSTTAAVVLRVVAAVTLCHAILYFPSLPIPLVHVHPHIRPLPLLAPRSSYAPLGFTPLRCRSNQRWMAPNWSAPLRACRALSGHVWCWAIRVWEARVVVEHVDELTNVGDLQEKPHELRRLDEPHPVGEPIDQVGNHRDH